MKIIVGFILLAVLITQCSSENRAVVHDEDESVDMNILESKEESATIRPDCSWCGADEAPEGISWRTTIAGEDVEGDRMILEGKVFEKDGLRPAKDVVIYAYHTNNKGLYEKKGDETGNGTRHGYLRGWVKTDSTGKYRFNTIRPAPYPNHSEPAHVHMTLKREDFDEYWINATWFKGDKIITDEMVEKLDRTGGFSNIIELEKNEDGAWTGTRNIIIDPPSE